MPVYSRSSFFRPLGGLTSAVLVGQLLVLPSGCASSRGQPRKPEPAAAAAPPPSRSLPQPALAQVETQVPTPAVTSSTGSEDEQAPATADPDRPASYGMGRSAHNPDVIPGPVLVRGSLDKLVIRRTLRGHLDELRACYLPALKKKPNLSGRASVQFTISTAGKVVDPVLQNSTLQDARVEKCVVKAFRSWEFPKPPGGGLVVVTHEFVFEAGGAGERHFPATEAEEESATQEESQGPPRQEITYGYTNEAWENDLRPLLAIYKDFAKRALSTKDRALLQKVLASKTYSEQSRLERTPLYNRWVDLENDNMYGRLKGDELRVEHAMLTAVARDAFKIEVTYKPGNQKPVAVSPTPFQNQVFEVMRKRELERKAGVLKALRQAPPKAIVQMNYGLSAKELRGGRLNILFNGKKFYQTEFNDPQIAGTMPVTQALTPGQNRFQLRIYPPKASKPPEFSGQVELMMAMPETIVDTTGGNGGAFADFLLTPTLMVLQKGGYYEVEATFEYLKTKE